MGPKVKYLIASLLLIAGSAAPASHWVAIATGPDVDPTGIYVDRDSLKGEYPVKTFWEKFLNSYREQNLSHLEINCDRHVSRTLEVITKSPSGAVLHRSKFAHPKSETIAHGSSQEKVRRFVCEAHHGKVAPSRPKSHHG